jgi:hypothetical protein
VIDPVHFWDYTPAETELMITVAAEKYNNEIEFESSLAARLCAVVMNANGATKQNKKPFETEDFQPKKQSKKQQFTAEQYEMMAKAATIKMGGTVNDLIG